MVINHILRLVLWQASSESRMENRSKQRIIRFLELYPIKKRNIEALELKIKNLDELCYPNGIDTSKDKVTNSNIQDSVYEIAQKREEKREQYMRQKKKAEEHVKLHDLAFEALSDTEQEVISKLYHGRRYADGKRWLATHGYSYRTIYRIREKALKKMDGIIFENKEYVILKKGR